MTAVHPAFGRRCLRALMALAAAGCAGCAHVQVDADGRRHVTGWVSMTLPPPLAAPGADAVRVRSLGLGWLSAPSFGGLSVGWQDTTLLLLRNDSAVCWAGRSIPEP